MVNDISFEKVFALKRWPLNGYEDIQLLFKIYQKVVAKKRIVFACKFALNMPDSD